MKNIFLYLLCQLPAIVLLNAQSIQASEKQVREIHALIDSYSKARETRDTILLKSILTPDVDQLVSTGEWRTGIGASVKGIMESSTNNAGKRTLTIDKIKMLQSSSALVDCRYEIQNGDSVVRKMWSSFILVHDKKSWKITAIRNMLPTAQ